MRDTARYFDACNGFDQRDPSSLPAVGGWEMGLGTHDLSGMTVAILPDLGIARVRTDVGDQRGGIGGVSGQGGRVARWSTSRPTCHRCGDNGPWRVRWDSSLIWATPIRIGWSELSPEMRMGLEGAMRAVHP